MYKRTDAGHDTGAKCSRTNLSYKFQRLREQIRNAILNGEFESRLPGERELGRRYRANPKTVNKALCDLSSEGLVIRQIGRGTFVAKRNGEPAFASKQRTFRCLLTSGSSGSPYRQVLVSTVREILAAKGHVWESLAVEPSDDSSTIPLAGWPFSTRRATDALLCYPCEPLSSGTGHLSDELVAETFRRHVPVVVLAACAPSAKLNAVVPDYMDAGFRLGEHLFQVGCEGVIVLRADVQGREVAMVISGCRASAARCHHAASEIVLGPNGAHRALRSVEALLDACRAPDGGGSRGVLPVLGIVCVGTRVLRAVTADEGLARLRSDGRLAITCVSEPGERSAAAAGVTSYEVDPGRIAAWAARLLLEARPGQRPVEVSVPGRLRVCCAQAAGDVESDACRPAETADTRSTGSGAASEAII